MPAVKGRLGIRDYFSTTMTLKDVSERIDYPNDHLFLLSERKNKPPQSTVFDEKYEQELSNYLKTDKERFLNSIVVGLFGKSKWQKFSDLPEPLNQFEHNIGFLTLSNKSKIFVIDGKHRLSAISKYVKNSKPNNKEILETVPVIFIQHEPQKRGRKRTEKLYNDLHNRGEVK